MKRSFVLKIFNKTHDFHRNFQYGSKQRFKNTIKRGKNRRYMQLFSTLTGVSLLRKCYLNLKYLSFVAKRYCKTNQLYLKCELSVSHLSITLFKNAFS